MRQQHAKRWLAIALGTFWTGSAVACAAHNSRVQELRVPSFERGFFAFPSPRVFDAPGTVFRIDLDGVRRPVADLSSLTRVTARPEAVPRLVVRSLIDGRAFVRWLGREDRGFGGSRLDSAYISLFGATREIAYEVALTAVVDSAAKLVDWTKSGAVYLITETISADSVEIGFVRESVFSTSDSASSVSSSMGVAARWRPLTSSRLAIRFMQPHRILYKAEQLVKRNGLENDSLALVMRVTPSAAPYWRSP